MPTSTRSRVLPEEADEGGPGTRSTRSKGAAKLEEGLPPRKKTKRGEEKSQTSGEKSPTSPQSDKGRKDPSPSKATKPPAAAAKVSADATSSPTRAEESTEEAATDASTVPACVICSKSGKEDSRPMITFENLGTFHVFCGKIAAINSSNRMPQYEIAEKTVLRHKYGVSVAVSNAFDKTVSATCEFNGKEYVSVPDFHGHLSKFKRFGLPERRPGSAPWLKKPPKQASSKLNTPNKKKKNKPKKETKRDPVVDQAVANALKARQPGTPSNVVRKKACICGRADCYAVLSRWVAVSDDKRCGYVSLPSWSSKDTERGELVNQFRELVFLNMLGRKDLAKEDDEKSTRKFVAFHHFQHIQLLPGNKGLVEFIEPALASALSLSTEYRIPCGPNMGKYLPSPRRTWTDMINELVGVERSKAALSAQLPVHPPHAVALPPPAQNWRTGQGAKAPGPKSISTNAKAPTLDATESQTLEKRLSEAPKDYDSLKALYVETETALALERKKNRDLDSQLSGTNYSMHAMQSTQAQVKKIVADMNAAVQRM